MMNYAKIARDLLRLRNGRKDKREADIVRALEFAELEGRIDELNKICIALRNPHIENRLSEAVSRLATLRTY